MQDDLLFKNKIVYLNIMVDSVKLFDASNYKRFFHGQTGASVPNQEMEMDTFCALPW